MYILENNKIFLTCIQHKKQIIINLHNLMFNLGRLNESIKMYHLVH